METETVSGCAIALIAMHGPLAYYFAFARLIDVYRTHRRQQAYRYF